MSDLINYSDRVGANLRQLRQAHESTLDEIARRTGLSKSFLSMLESGKRSAKLADLRNILACYGYSLGRFVSEAHDTDSDGLPVDPGRIVQTADRAILMDGTREEGKYRLLLMRPVRSSGDIEVVDLYLPPQSQMTESNMSIDAEVRGIVRRGTLLIVLQGDEYRAREGDEFCYAGSIPHLLRNYTDQPTAVSLVVSPPNF